MGQGRGLGAGPVGTSVAAPIPGAPAPAPAAPTTGGRQATWDEVITAIAKQHKVNPRLALAVANRESSINPNAVGDSGKAIGMFQLHEGAAKDAGITDRNDPMQNITGGVKYLRQLSDRYDGDLTKTLQAYNGGLANVDAGTVSPEAQLYATQVLGNVLGTRPAAQQAAQATGRASGAGNPMAAAQAAQAQSTTEEPVMQGIVEGMGRAIDPRTPEGRLNIASGVGAAGMAWATGGVTVLPAVARVLGPIVGAAAAAYFETTAENAMGTSTADPATAALEQGTMEAAGGVIMWPLKTVGKSLIAPGIGRRAFVGTHAEEKVAHTAAQDMLDAARTFRDATVDATEAAGRAQVAATRQAGRQSVETATTAGRAEVVAASRRAADVRAATDLRNTEIIADLTREYDTLLGKPPSILQTGRLADDVVTGPAKRALDLAGARVEEAARKGPMINMQPVRDAVRQMFAKARPSSVFDDVDAMTKAANPEQVAYLAKLSPAQRAGVVKQMGGEEGLAQALGLPADHPLPGLLGRIQSMPLDQISMADAHALKRLLDEGVIWDRTAKKHVEQITKGVRTILREQMSADKTGYKAYDIATQAFENIVPLYRRGVGKAFIKAAETNPDAIASMLKIGSPARAQAMKDLLVQQASEGGDPALGLRAWNAVRSHFTYTNLLTKNGTPDPTGLSDRVASMLNQSPEFARIVYGSADGAVVLSNLTALGDAINKAVVQEAEQRAIAKLGTREGVAVVQEGVMQRTGVVKEEAKQATDAVTVAASRAVRDARRAGTRGVQGARQAGQAGVEAAQAKISQLRESSVGRYTDPSKLTSLAGDVLRAATQGPASTWGGLSLLRLLRGPKGAELVQWAAYSPKRTQMLAAALNSQLPEHATAMLLRDFYAAATTPATPEQPAGPAPTGAPPPRPLTTPQVAVQGAGQPPAQPPGQQPATGTGRLRVEVAQ